MVPAGKLVCWILLLVELHVSSEPVTQTLFQEARLKNPNIADYSWHAVRMKQRSWDFMPPEMVRPFATTTISEIVILACRLGVIWKDFRPTEGVMEGQGRGHVFSATRVRGIGTMLSYTRLMAAKHERDDTFEEAEPSIKRFKKVTSRLVLLRAYRASDEEITNPTTNKQQHSESSDKITE